MTTDTESETFKEVEPLYFRDECVAVTYKDKLGLLHKDQWTYDEARALRDWLNKALGEA